MAKALLLAGGGARGCIQLGAVSALLQSGFEYDMLHGTSAGALNAALIHAGKTKELFDVWSNIRNNQVYFLAPWLALTPAASLLSSTPLANLIKECYVFEGLHSNPKPLFVTATNTSDITADTRRLPLATPELTNNFILASASYPIGLPTVELPSQDGKSIVRLSDGGTMLNYGILAAIQMGYNDITVINPSYCSPVPIKGILSMIDFIISSMGRAQLHNEETAIRLLNHINKEVKLTIYGPDAPVPLQTLDFDSAGKFFNQLFILGQNMVKKPVLEVRHRVQQISPTTKALLSVSETSDSD